MIAPPAVKRPSGRHILGLALWLWLLAPVGLWKLWQDRELTSNAKWRILIYSFIVPLLAYLAVSLWTANQTLTHYLP